MRRDRIQAEMLPDPVIPASYWITPWLAAGQYPGAPEPDEAARKVERFRQAGITTFVDLTHEWDGLEPYDHLLTGQRRHRWPIVDNDVPSMDDMTAILDTIDRAHADGETVYVHCWGGHGRTGTVVGCWRVRHGSSPADAIALIARRRRPLPVYAANPSSPQTRAQHAFVHAWRSGQ